MKIIHCADLHLDSKINEIPIEKSKIIREECFNNFEKLVNFAKENDVKVILISGDMFDTSNVTNKTRNKLINLINSSANIDFLYLSGNHDEEIKLFSETEIPLNFKFFTENQTSFYYDNICITGINLADKNLLNFYDELDFDKNFINILSLHGQITEYMTNENSKDISIKRLQNKNIDYLALGHIHSFSEGKIDERGSYCYSGCLSPRGFDETRQKGFVLLEINEKKLNYKFINISSYNFAEEQFDVTSQNNFYALVDSILDKLKSNYDYKTLIKIILTGEYDKDFEIDKDYLNMKINNAFFYGKVYDKTSMKINIKDYENNKTIEGEFVRLVYNSELDDDLKNSVLKLGINAFKEDN